MSDEKLAAQIRQDHVDVLFDLAGHTADNRLLVFARKPAPLQASWLGYVGTTGLEAMDFVVADQVVVPTEDEDSYSEQILRLPETRLCWACPADAPAVGPLPAQSNGFVTFGSVNNPAKVTPEVLACWAEILRHVPRGRLILKYRGFDDAGVVSRVQVSFADAGVEATRVELRGPSPHAQMMQQYNEIDVALDPFTGGITTCEALWMGVPVVTCPLETFASRQTLGVLSSIGITETVASDLDDYVTLAVGLAKDLPALAELRAGLRPRMSHSALCNAEQFAGQFLATIRQCWRQWCVDFT